MNKAVRMWRIRATYEPYNNSENAIRRLWAHAVLVVDIEGSC